MPGLIDGERVRTVGRQLLHYYAPTPDADGEVTADLDVSRLIQAEYGKEEKRLDHQF